MHRYIPLPSNSIITPYPLEYKRWMLVESPMLVSCSAICNLSLPTFTCSIASQHSTILWRKKIKPKQQSSLSWGMKMDSSRVECKLWWVHDIHIVTNTLQVDLLTLTQHLLAHRIFSDKDMWWERRWWCNSEYSANHNLCYFWNIFIIITNTIIGSIRSNSPLCTWCIIECWSLVQTLKNEMMKGRTISGNRCNRSRDDNGWGVMS